MNAMAAVGNVQRAPEIVIVNDGRPVENVGASSKGATILKIAVPALVAIVVGIAIGKIGSGASQYNEGLKGARTILGDKATPSTVASLKATLSELDTLLDEAKNKNQFHPDSAIDKQLEAIAAKLDVKSDLVFQVKQNLDTEQSGQQLSGQMVSFYAGVTEVKALVDAHVKSAKSDDISLSTAKKKLDDATVKDTENAALAGQIRYAVLMQAATETDKDVAFGAKIVELGPPYCGTGANPTTSGRCPEGESITAYAYRSEPGATWTKGELASQMSDAVPTKKLVLWLPGGVRDSLVKGAEGVASEVYYVKRLRSLYERVHGKAGNDGKAVGGLLEDGNKLETRLETESKKSSRFSFFM